jgi:hypothetical protein
VKLLGLLAEHAVFSHIFLHLIMDFHCFLVEVGGTVHLDDVETSPILIQEALYFLAIPAKKNKLYWLAI